MFRMVVACCVWLAMPGDVPAREETQRTLRVGFTEFAPYSVTAPDGRVMGFSIDSLRLLLEPRGYALEFVSAKNPGQMLDLLTSGQVQMTTLLAINPARAEKGVFSAQVSEASVSVFYARGQEGPRDIAGLAGHRIGVTPGSVSEALIKKIDGVYPVHFTTFEGVLMAQLRGDIDALVAPAGVLWSVATHAGLSDRLVQGPVLQRANLGFLVSPDLPMLTRDLDAAIAEAARHGALAAIEREWLRTPERLAQSWRLVAFALVGLLTLVTGAWGYVGFTRLRQKARRGELLRQVLQCSDTAIAIGKPSGEPELLTHADTGSDQSATANARRFLAQKGAGAESVSDMPAQDDGPAWIRRSIRLGDGTHAAFVMAIDPDSAGQAPARAFLKNLEAENEKLRDFTSIVAHDLKAPLRNVRLVLDWVEEDLATADIRLPEATAEKVGMIHNLVDRQTRLISDLLNYTRGQDLRDRVAFDPMRRLEGILELASLPRGFTVEIPTPLPKVNVNPVAFDTVLRNLVSNAARHHDRSSGCIQLLAGKSEGRCEITVVDDGPGVPEPVRKKIFDAFYRHDASGSETGFGLGLALVAKEVDGWGGTVVCRPRRDGQRGSEFSFTLPLAADEEREWRPDEHEVVPQHAADGVTYSQIGAQRVPREAGNQPVDPATPPRLS